MQPFSLLRSFSLFALAGVLLTGCSYHGELAKVTASKSYSATRPLRIVVLPFTAEGNPDIQRSEVVADQVGAALMSLGHTVVDHKALMLKASELGIAPKEEFSQA